MGSELDFFSIPKALVNIVFVLILSQINDALHCADILVAHDIFCVKSK